ncbi:hypothetical protein GCM10020331_095710 [Ectobacillus funiculus]
MSSLVLGFQEMDKNTAFCSLVEKGLNLGELSKKFKEYKYQKDFCVTTVGYQKKPSNKNETFQALLDQLTLLKVEDRDQIGEISRKIRQIIMEVKKFLPTL